MGRLTVSVRKITRYFFNGKQVSANEAFDLMADPDNEIVFSWSRS